MLKIFYDLLRPIPTHPEGPHDFEKNVITLMDADHRSFHLKCGFP